MSASWWSSLTFLCMNKCEKQNRRFSQVSVKLLLKSWRSHSTKAQTVSLSGEDAGSDPAQKPICQAWTGNMWHFPLSITVHHHGMRGYHLKLALYKVYSWPREQRKVIFEGKLYGENVWRSRGESFNLKKTVLAARQGADTLKQADTILQHQNFSSISVLARQKHLLWSKAY